jgi:hypothetical protein
MAIWVDFADYPIAVSMYSQARKDLRNKATDLGSREAQGRREAE